MLFFCLFNLWMNAACFRLDAALFSNVSFIWGIYSRTAFNRVFTMLLQTNLIYGTQHKGKKVHWTEKSLLLKLLLPSQLRPYPGFVYVIAWFLAIFGINTTSDISKLLFVISRAVRRVKFETILKYHKWYLCQISRTKRFVIFTCRYFNLGWNTTALSQSNCSNSHAVV